MMQFLKSLTGEGTFLFKGIGGRPAIALAAGVLALLAAAWFLQVRTLARPRVRRAAALARLGSFCLILLMLAEPVVRRETSQPRESFLAYLVDTSASMGIKDYDSRPRFDAVQDALASSTRRERLDRQYRSMAYSFDESLQVCADTRALQAGKKATDLAGALHSLQYQTAGLPLAGVVLFSDGNASLGADRQGVLEAATQLKAPIYTIGSAPQTPAPDFWIDRVVNPGEVPAGVGTRVTVLVGTHGMRSQPLEAILSADGREVQRISLNPSAEDQTLPAQFTIRPLKVGMANFHVRVTGPSGEAYPWNDDQDFFVRVRQDRRRLLYVEGSPRYEYRFLRAAFENDQRFRMSAMIYLTGGDMVYRQGLADKAELAGGFPQTREELFSYDVVVIGDVPASRFSRQQLESLREFVRQRGGGLLLLAGEHSFAAGPGGYGDSPLADVLPFQFGAGGRLDRPCRVVPTAEGVSRGIFGPAPSGGAPPWTLLPPLMELYPLGGLKPGAVRLCEIDQGRAGQNPPVVVYQRYGQGTSLICGISATWPWKFRMPSDNPSYAAFWKEMALILLEQAEGQIRLEAAPSIVAPGGEVTLQGAVYDKAFKPDPSVAVRLSIEGPGGATPIELVAQSELKGETTFRAAFKPQAPGAYKVVARGGKGATGQPLERDAMFLVQASSPELQKVHLNDGLLREIATVSGGEYLQLKDFENLPEKIKPRQGSRLRVQERTLWDHPLILLALLGLLLGEWTIRRVGNMA